MSFYYKLKKAFYPGGAADFTPQFRIEVSTRNPNAPDILAMRTADPLWMLGRQWQFGEFIGEDNGTPIQVDIHFKREFIDHFSELNLSSGTPINGTPLEAKVEAVNPPEEEMDLRTQVRIGQQLERFINESSMTSSDKTGIITSWRKELPLQKVKWRNHDLRNQERTDEKSERFYRMMQGKVIGGYSLVNNIGKLNSNRKIPKSTKDKFQNWLGSYLVKPEAKTWDQNQLAHKFKLTSSKTNPNVTLEAPDYQSGHLDWYSFDKASVKKLPSKADSWLNMTPVNVSFPSMPDKRLFSFEDSKIDLSLMEVNPDEMIKLMLLDFALVSGSDWYTIPMTMGIGEACWIEKIVVKDVFGVKTVIENDGTKGAILNKDPLKVWDIFKIRPSNALLKNPAYKQEEHFLYIPPTVINRMESEPIEEVMFLRDEYSNMVWALEQKIPNGMGQPINGFDLHLELYGPFIEPDDDEKEAREMPAFKLASTVPSNWIPYLPIHINNDQYNIKLERAYMVRNENDSEATDIKPLTYLAEKDLLSVHEEAIPRAGVRVQLTKQRVRWTDGKTYVWMGRKVLAGRGEGNSGLRFDFLIE